jgi:hypothetical protein
MEPVANEADTLYIVSGYATAAMTFHHLEALKKRHEKNISINLIVGMCPDDGLSASNHKAFQQLSGVDFINRFICSYIIKTPQVHSKSYAWFKGDKPIIGFVGSANYTQNAFSKSQRELLIPCDPELGLKYYNSLMSDAISCRHKKIESYLEIYRDPSYGRRQRRRLEEQGLTMIAPTRPDLQGLPAVKFSILDKAGKKLPQRSGLNWGQRPELHREPNQAYIKLPSDIYKTTFFPPKTVHFSVLTDDNKVLICTRAQDNSKAIETPHNNSIIGKYFRNRLGVPLGEPVTLEDLIRYGRTDVAFYKIDDETYFMDFSVPP